MPILDVEQGSSAWYEARRGKLTSSRISRLFGKQSTRDRLLEELLRERDAGPGGWMAGADITSPDIRRGLELEPRAVALFEMLHLPTRKVGMVTVPNYPDLGASVDRLVLDGEEIQGALEIKCPRAKGHLETWIHGLPAKHRDQVYFEAWASAHLGDGTPRAWFASFCEDVEPTRHLYVEEIRVPQDWIGRLERALDFFLPRLDRPALISGPESVPVFF